MRSVLALGVVFGLSTGLHAAVFTYDGSTVPSPLGGAWYYATAYDGGSNPYTFQGVRFAATSWGSSGGVLTMATVHGQGLWIGSIEPYYGNYNPNWRISDPTVGNAGEIRVALTPGSKEWSFYLTDGSYGAAFEFNDNLFTYYINQSGAVAVNVPIDGTQFHTYGFYLKNGLVTYTLDGSTIFTGAAYLTSGKNMLIGDGSGSTITGVGSFAIDYFTIDTAPAGPIPEPASLGILTAGGALLTMRRRRMA